MARPDLFWVVSTIGLDVGILEARESSPAIPI